MREFVPRIFVRICFSRATSDIFARVFLRLLVCIFENSRFSCFFGAVGALSWPFARFSCFFRVFRVFAIFVFFAFFVIFALLVVFAALISRFFCFSLIFVIFSGSFGHFSFSRFSRGFHGHSAFSHGQSHGFSRYHFFGRLAISTKRYKFRRKQNMCEINGHPFSQVCLNQAHEFRFDTPYENSKGMKAPCASHGSGEKWI